MKKKLAKKYRYFTWAHNIEGCLRNGSFVGQHYDGTYFQYMNGDHMGTIAAVPKGMVEVTEAEAKEMLPKCCGGLERN